MDATQRERIARSKSLPARLRAIFRRWDERPESFSAEDLVLPMFVREGIDKPQPISSMPGVVQHSLESAIAEVERAVAAGIGGIMLFGIPLVKDAIGSGATDPDGILTLALRGAVEAADSRLFVMSDLCLDEFTDHGHCGVLTESGSVDNDATLERYADMAVLHAKVGTHMLGMSGMMDGQVRFVREALDRAEYKSTMLLAYTAKYASSVYGPFRDAVNSSLMGG